MAEYHYKYGPSNPSGGQNQPAGGRPPRNNRPDKDSIAGWIVVGLGFAFHWLAGVFLLIRRLLVMSNDAQTRRFRERYNPNNQAQAPSQAQTQAAPPPKAAAKSPKDFTGLGFIIGGGATAGIFGLSLLIAALTALIGWLTGSISPMEEVVTLSVLAFFTAVGGVLLNTGLSRRRQTRRYKQYLAFIGKRERVSVSAIAKASGQRHKKVQNDLQKMLDFGVLPMGYLDLANDQLVLTDRGLEDEPEEEAPVQPTAENDILAEIRAVNDQIPDPVMSAKIARIEEITGKILDYQRQNPAKAGQLRSFLNYYLPTTLKILRSYAQLDSQGVEGENISATKARIEGMMDKVVEGFEKQLDKLFQDDALDITTDVAVLEQMLDNDGLSSSGGMTATG